MTHRQTHGAERPGGAASTAHADACACGVASQEVRTRRVQRQA